jgi:hypothetical protein
MQIENKIIIFMDNEANYFKKRQRIFWRCFLKIIENKYQKMSTLPPEVYLRNLHWPLQ